MLQFLPVTDSAPENLSKTDRTGATWRIFQVISIRSRLIASVLASNLRLTHALPAEWRKRYDAARRDLDANDAVFHPGKQWTIITRFYRLLLRGRGLDRFKSTFGRFLSSYEATNPRIFEAAHHLYFQALRPRDVWGLLDSIEEPELGSGNWLPYRGKRLSLDLLQSIDELYRLKESLGFEREDRVVFCELGAGYGRLADVVLRAMPNAVYMIFDLPESLLLSQHYLTALHPGAKAALYPGSESALSSPEAVRSHRLIFGLPHQLRSVPPGVVDAFINIYSFMEMGREQIAAYFDAIERLQPRALYLKQHKREANIYDKSLNTQESYPVRPSWREVNRGTSALFEHVFESTWLIRPKV